MSGPDGERFFDDFTEIAFAWPGSLLIGGGVLSGIALLTYQSYLWLKTGTWVEYPMSFFLLKANLDLNPIYYPKSWQGVANVARWFTDMHAGLCMIWLGVALLFLGFFVEWLIQNTSKS